MDRKNCLNKDRNKILFEDPKESKKHLHVFKMQICIILGWAFTAVFLI